MKNCLVFRKNNCRLCKASGLYITTPSGADYTICPVCNRDVDYSFYDSSSTGDNYHKMNKLYNCIDSLGCDDITEYCNDCGLLFGLSHQHAILGCTDDIYHTLTINRYRINDVIYEGSPVFESYEEAMHVLRSNTLEILDSNCSCDNYNYCKYSYHRLKKIKKETVECELAFAYKINKIKKIQRWFRNVLKSQSIDTVSTLQTTLSY